MEWKECLSAQPWTISNVISTCLIMHRKSNYSSSGLKGWSRESWGPENKFFRRRGSLRLLRKRSGFARDFSLFGQTCLRERIICCLLFPIFLPIFLCLNWLLTITFEYYRKNLLVISLGRTWINDILRMMEKLYTTFRTAFKTRKTKK